MAILLTTRPTHRECSKFLRTIIQYKLPNKPILQVIREGFTNGFYYIHYINLLSKLIKQLFDHTIFNYLIIEQNQSAFFCLRKKKVILSLLCNLAILNI